MTGTYRFQTRFYGLTDMQAEFQKAMDCTLIGMIVIKGSEAEHKEYVLKCLKRLDHENLKSNLPKCRFSKLEIVIGYFTYREQDLHYFVSRSAKDIKKNFVLFWAQYTISANS